MNWLPSPVQNPKDPQYLSVKLVKGGPRCAALVVHKDGLWFSTLNGEPHGDPVDDENAAGGFIQGWRSVLHVSVAEYEFLLARYQHAKLHDPNSPFANPFRAIDLRLLPPLGYKK